MSKYDDWIQCEETIDLVVWEEWVEWVGGGMSLPKNEDRACGDSQPPVDLTDLPF